MFIVDSIEIQSRFGNCDAKFFYTVHVVDLGGCSQNLRDFMRFYRLTRVRMSTDIVFEIELRTKIIFIAMPRLFSSGLQNQLCFLLSRTSQRNPREY